MLVPGKAVANVMSSDELKELFSLQPDTLSNTYESMCGVPAALPAEAEGVHAPEGHGVAMAQRGAAEITKAQVRAGSGGGGPRLSLGCG